ncbi:hypothetical protein [Polluticoccus soli]|uniref:hypothetical protein n=1 Tax=Polluticoccus soli TaxID=3034150 RepID=UPI0023E224B6|nr:hypothetical protein [Flavipsychrobacter sp. JY13-12]
MNDEKITRIPAQHLIYVKEYIRTGDKERAYGKAYPNAQPQSRKPAAWRLSRRPEIQELIDEKQKASIEKGFAAAEAEAAERHKKDFLSLHERRVELARIVRRQARMNKYYKFKEEVKTMEVTVDNPAAILRAIELDTKLEAEYFAKKPAVEKAKETRTDEEKFRLLIYIDKKAFGGEEEDLTDEEYDYAIKQSLTNDGFRICPPKLRPDWEELGCVIHRDMETGKYEYHCPADKVKTRQENGKTIYYYEQEEKDKEQVTSGNIDSRQTTGTEHEAEKSLMRHAEPEKLPPQPPVRQYIYPTDRAATKRDEWAPIERVLDDYWEYYLKNQNMTNMRGHEAIVRLSRSRNLPPEKRRELELETGWEFHPDRPGLVRRVNHGHAQKP